jgi:hypothetical protein
MADSPTNERELATILAALRFWKSEGMWACSDGMEHFEDVTPLTDDEIDDLCKRLSLSGAEALIT